MVRSAHWVRDGRAPGGEVTDTGERFDVVIVGGGLAGLSAAHHFKRHRPGGRCLVIENHPVFGGEAKRNDIMVDGVRLAGPQGSNDFGVRPPTGEPDDYFTTLGIPREFEYASDAGEVKAPFENYGFMHWVQDQFSIGHYFGGTRRGGRPGWSGGAGGWVNGLFGDTSRAPWTPRLLVKTTLSGRRRCARASSAGATPASRTMCPRMRRGGRTIPGRGSTA